LNGLNKLPYIYAFNNKSIENLFSKYPSQYIEFRHYFEKYWKKFFAEGMLDFTKIQKEYRSNSYCSTWQGGGGAPLIPLRGVFSGKGGDPPTYY